MIPDQAELKQNHELRDCAIDSRIILIFHDGNEYHGIFRGMDSDDTIMLRAENRDLTIGLPFGALKFWLLKL